MINFFKVEIAQRLWIIVKTFYKKRKITLLSIVGYRRACIHKTLPHLLAPSGALHQCPSLVLPPASLATPHPRPALGCLVVFHNIVLFTTREVLVISGEEEPVMLVKPPLVLRPTLHNKDIFDLKLQDSFLYLPLLKVMWVLVILIGKC